MTSTEQNRVIRSIAAFLVEQLIVLKNCSRDEALAIQM